MLNRPDCTQTAVDGAFYFLDLPAGVYTFTVSLSSLGSRYGVVAATRVVPSNDVADLYVTADVALPPTTITGVVTDQSAAAVSMAKVQLVGSCEFTFADGDGRYALTGVEAGNRTIKISAKGFQTSFLPVTLADAGAVQTLDVVLSQ